MQAASTSRFALVLGILIFALVPVASLHAQATKIFVASFGNDANDGSRGSPKRNFQAAHDAVAAGGEVVALDTAGYGALNITKGVTVNAPPGIQGFITVTSSANGIAINAGAGDTVTLRGLTITGGGAAGNGSGIALNSGGALRVERCAVRAFGNGILQFSSAFSAMVVSDTTVADVNYGVYVRAGGSANTAQATVNRCTVTNAVNVGMVAILPAGSNTAYLAASDCVVTNSGVGFSADGTATYFGVDNCRVNYCNIAFQRVNNGNAYTRGNNTVFIVNTVGTFSGPNSPQ